MATNGCRAYYFEREPAVYIPIATLTILVGGFTIALALCMKLHKKVLYRLVMYQVLVGMAYGAFWLLHLIGKENSGSVLITVVQSLLLFAAGIKLLLGVSLTVHIYILAVVQRNIPKLEFIYVTTSLLVPLALAVAYGVVNYMCKCGGNMLTYSDITIFALSAVLIAAACVCSVVVLLLVGRRIYMFRISKTSEQSYIERQHVKAVCEMIPLFAYLLIFLAHILGLLALVLYIYMLLPKDYKQVERVQTILESSWGLVASLTFAVHLAIVVWVKKFCVKSSIARYKQQYGTIADAV